MLGSLNKVWPWKEVEKLVSDGHEVMIEHNIALNTEVAEAVVLMLIGFIFGVCIGKDFSQKGITDWMEMYKKKLLLAVGSIVCRIPLFVFGTNVFNTRGEPREAVVALSMLQQGNWVLPVNNGVELAFKPPFFHWCIAAISTVAGAVNEYTSRMPSALALSAMVLVGYVFYAKRRGAEVAFIAALLTLTNFEVHRAGVACRVDMVLTAMMVIALYQLYKWGRKTKACLGWPALLECGGP